MSVHSVGRERSGVQPEGRIRQRVAGGVQQRREVGAVAEERAHARGEMDAHLRLAGAEHVGLEGVQQLVQPPHAVVLVHAVGTHDELLAAPATNDILDPETGAQQPAQPAQHRVAHGVAARFLDRPQIVHVDGGDGERLAVTDRETEQALDGHLALLARRHTRERFDAGALFRDAQPLEAVGNAGEQVGGDHRLGEEVIGAGHVRQVVGGRVHPVPQHEHRRARPALVAAQHAAQLEAAVMRHVHVEEHDFGADRLHRLPEPARIIQRRKFDVGGLELLPQGRERVVVIVHGKDVTAGEVGAAERPDGAADGGRGRKRLAHQAEAAGPGHGHPVGQARRAGGDEHRGIAVAVRDLGNETDPGIGLVRGIEIHQHDGRRVAPDHCPGSIRIGGDLVTEPARLRFQPDALGELRVTVHHEHQRPVVAETLDAVEGHGPLDLGAQRNRKL